MLKCPIHRAYKVERKPRCLCEPCWRMWIHKQDKEKDRAYRAAAMLRRGIIPQDYCVGDV